MSTGYKYLSEKTNDELMTLYKQCVAWMDGGKPEGDELGEVILYYNTIRSTTLCVDLLRVIAERWYKGQEVAAGLRRLRKDIADGKYDLKS